LFVDKFFFSQAFQKWALVYLLQKNYIGQEQKDIGKHHNSNKKINIYFVKNNQLDFSTKIGNN